MIVLTTLSIIFTYSFIVLLLYFIFIVILGIEWLFYNIIEINLIIDLIYLSALLCLFLLSGIMSCW